MKSRHYLRWMIPLAVIGVFLAYSLLLAGGEYTISWHTFDGGGATFSTGGTYRLGSSVGQPDAGASAGGAYNLRSGFWAGAEPTATATAPTPTPVTPTATAPPPSEIVIYLPLVIKK